MNLAEMSLIGRDVGQCLTRALAKAVRSIQKFWRHALCLVLFLLSISITADTFYLVIKYFHAVFFWDAWATVDNYRRYLAGQYGLADLFAQHNEHRIAIPRLVFFSDFVFGRGLNIINILATNLIQVLHTILLIRIAASILTGLRLVTVAALVGILMMNFGHSENFQWGFQVQFVGVYAASSLGLWWFSQAVSSDKGVNIGYLFASFVMVLIATYCMSNGFICGFIFVLLSIRQRTSIRILLVTSGFALVNAAAYFYTFHYVSQHSPPGYAISHPSLFLAYVLVYLGAPLGNFGVGAAGTLGALGVFLTAAAALCPSTEGRRAEAQAAMLGIMIFVVATALGTALGRVFFGLHQALESRYLVPGAVFWAAQTIYWASAHFAKAPRIAPAMFAASAVIPLVGSLSLHEAARDNVLWRSRKSDAVTDVLLSGVDRPDVLRDAYPSAEEVVRLSRFMFDRRLNIFALPEANWRGLSIFRLGKKRDDTACEGAAVTDSGAPQNELFVGWAWDKLGKVPVKRVVITDPQDRVTGFGSGSWFWFRPDWKRTPQIRNFDVGWRAFAKNDGKEFEAYALVQSDSVICRLPRIVPPARPDGDVDIPKQIDLSRLGSAIDLEPIMAGAWKQDGVPRPNEAPPPVGPLSGSWDQGKSGVGNVSLGSFVAPGARFAVPYLTGADTSGLTIEIGDAETGQTYARIQPRKTSEWTALEIDIPRDMSGRNLILRGFSSKGGADTWLALGLPHAIR